MPLLLGIKRKTHRRQDAQAAMADAEFAAVRDEVLRRHAWRCVDCGWKSEHGAKARSTLQVHHVDDDHHNNDPANLVPKCALDHACHHIGCNAPSVGGHAGQSDRMRIAFAPWLEQQDLNLLQMAIGAAWDDTKNGAAARAIYQLLALLTRPVQETFGTHHARDFAAAMERLTPQQYECRPVQSLRVVFHPDLLQEVAKAWAQDYPLLSPASWSTLINPKVLEHGAR